MNSDRMLDRKTENWKPQTKHKIYITCCMHAAQMGEAVDENAIVYKRPEHIL